MAERVTPIPRVVSESTVKLGQIEVRVYVLDDGRRIVDGRDIEAFMAKGDLPTIEEIRAMAEAVGKS